MFVFCHVLVQQESAASETGSLGLDERQEDRSRGLRITELDVWHGGSYRWETTAATSKELVGRP